MLENRSSMCLAVLRTHVAWPYSFDPSDKSRLWHAPTGYQVSETWAPENLHLRSRHLHARIGPQDFLEGFSYPRCMDGACRIVLCGLVSVSRCKPLSLSDKSGTGVLNGPEELLVDSPGMSMLTINLRVSYFV